MTKNTELEEQLLGCAGFKEEIVIEEETLDEFDDIMNYCAKENPPAFNFNKALEEAAEFIEATLKYQTKHPDNPKRPDVKEILKEYADFMYRGLILLAQLFPDKTLEEITDEISNHVEHKLEYLIKWRDSGQYKGGL